MFRNSLLILVFASLLSLGSCDHGASANSDFGGASGGSSWGGPGTDDGGGGGGGTTPPTMAFDGPQDASPTSHTAISVQWNAAVVTSEDPFQLAYDVFRADTVDMAGEVLAGTVSGGALSLVDSDLTSGQTYFYRVLARTNIDLASDNADVVSAHLPTVPSTPMDYTVSIEPLWSRLGSDGSTTCLTCHDGATADLDLTSWEGLMIGVGTPASPDSFILPTLGRESFDGGISRIKAHSPSMPAHKMWKTQAGDFKVQLVPWIDEGATAAADVTAPTFDPGDLANPSLHFVAELDVDRITFNFPHASDPESAPYMDLGGDHLEYQVFGGLDSNSIDWDNYIKKLDRLAFNNSNGTRELKIQWPHDTGVFVVRAVDFNGNQSIAEYELMFERAPVQ